MSRPFGFEDTHLNTILAALRYYQENGQGDPANRSDDIQSIACPTADDTSLDADGIDELCEAIKFSDVVIEDALSRRMTIDELQEVALANGIAILDWRDAGMLQLTYRTLREKDVPALLKELSERTGDWDDAIDSDYTDIVMRQAAEAAGIELEPDEELPTADEVRGTLKCMERLRGSNPPSWWCQPVPQGSPHKVSNEFTRANI